MRIRYRKVNGMENSMSLEGKTIGVAFTGSFCMYKKVFEQLEKLVYLGADVQTIFSNASQITDSRFGEAKEFMERAERITGKCPLLTIPEVEPIGPKGYLDALVIVPCTGNTTAKLANGITDTPVLMAAKAHLRNEKPLILAISSNDALGMNMKNIGILLNVKNVYFVPFGQDAPVGKPNSLVAHMDLVADTIEKALEGKQIQPLVVSPW